MDSWLRSSIRRSAAARYNRHLLRSRRVPTARQERRRLDAPLRRSGIAGDRGPAFTSTGSPAIRARTSGNDQPGNELSGHGVVQRQAQTRRARRIWRRQPPTRDGSICRLNGRTYPRTWRSVRLGHAAIDAGYNYPNASTSRLDQHRGACKDMRFQPSEHVSATPITTRSRKVQYCSSKDAAGFGHRALPGSQRPCDGHHRYVRYGTGRGTFDPQAFTRVDIGSDRRRRSQSQRPHLCAGDGQLREVVCVLPNADPCDEDGRRHRLFGADREERARGFHTLSREQRRRQLPNVAPFNAAEQGNLVQRSSTRLDAGGSTPLPDAVWRIGEYFSNSRQLGPAGRRRSARSGHRAVPAELPPDVDRRLLELRPRRPARRSTTRTRSCRPLPGPVPGFTPGSAFPRPYYEGPTPTSNTLADLAMHYWIRDIRPDARRTRSRTRSRRGSTSRCTACRSVRKGPFPIPAASTTSRPAPELADTQSGDLARPRNAGPEAIDDLWHAAINSRGNTSTPRTRRSWPTSIVSSLTDFTGQSGTGTAVGIAGAQFSATKSFGYRTSYEVGWWGDVKKYALDPRPARLPSTARQSAQRAALVGGHAARRPVRRHGLGYDRRIVTINDAIDTAVPFRLAQLSPAQTESLNAGWRNVTPTPSAAGGTRLPAGRSVERGRRPDEFPGAHPHPRRHRLFGRRAGRRARQPYADAGNPGYQRVRDGQAIADAHGLRRRQRRHAARFRRLDHG